MIDQNAAMHSILGFNKIAGFSGIEDFERHLDFFLSSGAYIFIDSDGPKLCFGRQIVDRVDGLRIVINPNDHMEPHFHVKGNNIDAAFLIHDGSLYAGRVDAKTSAMIKYWYQNSKERLVEVWNTTRSSDSEYQKIKAS